MATRGQKIKLVVFLIGLGALVALFLSMLGRNTVFERYDTYYVDVPDSVEGLERGSAVKLRGVAIGTVEEMTPVADGFVGVRLRLAVNEGLRIKSDEKAYLQYRGVTGLKIVDIMGGTPESGFFEPGATIPYDQNVLDALATRAEQLTEDVSLLLSSTNQLMMNLSRISEEVDHERVKALFDRAEGTLTHLERTSEHVSRAAADVDRRLPEILDRSQAALKTIEATFAKAVPVVEQAGRAMANVDGVVAEARAAVGDLGGAAGGVQRIVSRNEEDLTAAIRNLRQASRSLEVLSRELRQRPSRVLFSRPAAERETE
jgi:phospholipid/cholesterol/gamma-HCH transport system substrate-binding protein